MRNASVILLCGLGLCYYTACSPGQASGLGGGDGGMGIQPQSLGDGSSVCVAIEGSSCPITLDMAGSSTSNPDGAGTPDMAGGLPTGTDGGLGEPIDPACALGQVDQSQEVLVPKWPALPDTVPSSCLIGYEYNNLENNSYTITSTAASQAITLEVDIATYTAADRVQLYALDAASVKTLLIDTCRLRTATYADPTGGTVRPPEDSIRDFRVALPAGTRKLVLDNSGASTPTYVRVLGLCDFTLTPASGAGSKWREVTSRTQN